MSVEPYRILVTDDEYASLEVLALLLKGAGFEVVTASDGEEALMRLAEGRIDLVITDYKMPKMDGGQLCERMLENPEFSRIPVIFTSATYRQDVPRPANVRAFFSKPLLFKTLIDQVYQLLVSNRPG